MTTQNTTFKLTPDDLALLESLAGELKCSRTDVVRRALSWFDRERRARHEIAKQFVARLHTRVPKGKNLMIGLDQDNEPFATIDGRERLDDVALRGRRFASGREKIVIVDLCDTDHDLYIPVGAIPEDTGGWILVVNPLPIQLAW